MARSWNAWIRVSYRLSGGGTLAPLPSIGPVWFLLALFWATLLLEVYKRLHCSPIITSIIVGVCSIISFRYFFLPWSIQEGMVASVFMTLGYIYRPKENRIKNQKALRIGIYGFTILYIVCCLHLNKHIDMVKCEYPFGVIDILGTTMCVITVLLISDMLVSSKCYHYSTLDIVGKHTMLILCIHTIEFNIFPWYIILKIFNILELDSWFGPTQALIRIIGAILIAKMAERIDLQNVF